MEKIDRLIQDGHFPSAFDYLVTESMRSGKVHGLSIAVAQDEVVCTKAYRTLLVMALAKMG
jgi:hypothetical protein